MRCNSFFGNDSSVQWSSEKLSSWRETFPPLESYLIGCSGGRDSVVLLDAMVTGGYSNLVVCYINHRLRGSAADQG